MTEGKRPGGLTALAVLNFVFGGFNGLLLLGMLAFVALVNADVSDPQLQEAQREAAEAWQQVGSAVLYAITAGYALLAVLLISSGIGYLQQKRFLGRVLGNAYAILSIAVNVSNAVVSKDTPTGGFNTITILLLVYPVLTLILLNTTFKEDFVR